MAKKYVPVGSKGVAPQARVAPGGETFSQAQKRQRYGLRTGYFMPTEKVGPERSFDSQTLQDMQAAQLLDSYATGAVVTPFEMQLNREEMAAYIEFFDDYDAKNTEYAPRTYAVDPTKSQASVAPTAPAPISVIPTSTINPQRPRTVGAGFEITDSERALGKITVVFRDGTYYNYYDIPVGTWEAFKAAPSKGKFIAIHLNRYPHGYAEMSSRDMDIAAARVVARPELHKAARVAQKTLSRRLPTRGKRLVQIKQQTRRRTR